VEKEMKKDFEKDLENFFKNYTVKPTQIAVNYENIKYIASRRPGGGNSQQRRVWKRKWLLNENRTKKLRNEVT
jgi:hypothetical protein